MKLSVLMAGAVLAAGALLAAPSAHAGACPADKVLKEPRELREVPDTVLRRTLAVVNVTGWRQLGNLRLRMRRLTVPVGGFVPLHHHDDRPSIVYIVSGEILEHSALCAVPILHRANEWTPEFGKGHSHWWVNVGAEKVVILSSDIIPPEYLDDHDDPEID